MNENVINIEIEKLQPHPSNPRTSLGDLTELAESIKANGIMQNLTVVKSGGDRYTVIIGHRRLEASKLAGRKTVPCFIATMTEQEQARTMLMENMQRKDLSVYEQAQGFQMMLDLGDTLQSISKATGFTQKTVKARLNLLELDKEKFAKTEERNISIDEYVKLDKIKDISVKNRLLDYIGTDNFAMELKKAISEQDTNEFKEMAEAFLSKFAEKSNGYPQGYRWYSQWMNKSDIKELHDAVPGNYMYSVMPWGISIYIKDDEVSQKPEKSEADIKREKRREFYEQKAKEHKALLDNIISLHNEFLAAFNDYGKQKNAILSWVVEEMSIIDVGEIFPIYSDDEIKALAEFLDIDVPEYEGRIESMKEWESLSKLSKKEPLKVMMAFMCVANGENFARCSYTSWDAGSSVLEYEVGKETDAYYKLLADLGYRPGKEEREYIAGKHSVFDKFKE